MQLLLMRHAQTNYNVRNLCNDDPTVEVHLTAEGIRQAEAAAERLSAYPIERILVSELPRTRETARIVNRHHHAPIDVEARLNDIRSGFEGRPVTDYFAAVGADRLHRRPPGGESMRDYQARVLPVLEWLRAQAWQCVLLVAHEETLRILAAHLDRLDDAAMLALDFPNCAIREYELDGGR